MVQKTNRSNKIIIELNGIEAAALEAVAKYEGVTPDHLLRDLIRDAAIFLITGQPRRNVCDVCLTKEKNDLQTP